MSGPRVFVVQVTQTYSHSQNKLVPKFDLGPARAFGELVFLLSPSAAPFNAEPIIRELHEKLFDYDYKKDHLLLVGNPCLIGFAVTVAADKSDKGEVRLLQWSGSSHRYLSIEAALFPGDN